MADDVAALRRQVALSCRILAMLGLVRETTGHVSARIPGTAEMLIRGRGSGESGLLFTRDEDVLRVDFDGNGVARDAAVSTPNELPIHGEIYKARPEAMCVVHAHPPGALLCGITGVELRPIFLAYDPSAARFGFDGVPVFPRSMTLQRPEEVWPMLELMGDKTYCLMRGHGITVYGASVPEATVRAVKLETLARINWHAAQRGGAPDVPAEDLEVFTSRGGPGTRRDSIGPVWSYYTQLLDQRGLLLNDPLLGRT
ncbi:MAG TPA: class II aldolase/adducin family protein [Chloroflexota bacterium]